MKRTASAHAGRAARTLVALLGVALLGGCQAVFFRAVNAGGEGIVATSHVYSDRYALSLDVYRPADAAGAAPVVLFFYGGSWRSGERGEYAFVGKRLAESGIVAIIADYRKFPVARFPAFEEDAASAARWTFDHATGLGGDPRRIFVAGHSAGGEIAALLATDAQYLVVQNLKPRDFAGAIGIAGPYDFLPLTDPKLIEVFGDESAWPASQPIRFVDGDEPPFLLLQGDRDRVVDPRNARVMAERLRAAGVPVTTKRYPNAGHFRILAAIRFASLGATLADVVAFVRATPPASR
jgi:acetyl esterase/lipase